MHWMRLLLAVFLSSSLTGCAIVQVSVRNPMPELKTVAIAPFFNLSKEPATDGREFANAYFAELQKVPGFEVVPVGVVEQAIREHRLEMEGPEDALQLAQLLKVDAVVIGAITDYDPYTPRLGLKVAWYSPKTFTRLTAQRTPTRLAIRGQSPDEVFVSEGVVSDEQWQPWNTDDVVITDEFIAPVMSATHEVVSEDSETVVIEAPAIWSVTPPLPEPADSGAIILGPLFGSYEPAVLTQAPPVVVPPSSPAPLPVPPTPIVPQPRDLGAPATSLPLPGLPAADVGAQAPSVTNLTPSEVTPPYVEANLGNAVEGVDPLMPLMSHIRMFDGADAELVSRVADYLELSGEVRTGDLQAFLRRSEFFIKFTAHVMVTDMLAENGGEARRRWVLKSRTYR